MDRWLIIGLVAGLAGSVIVAGIVLYSIFRAAMKRKQKMKSAALRLGFDYEPRGESIASSDFAVLPLLKKGVGIRSSDIKEQSENILRGTAGLIELVIFDFRYSTGGGGAGYKITAAAFQSGDNPLPAFEVRPRGLLGMHIAGRDESIRFDSDPAFFQAYSLIGKDESAIEALFSPMVRRILLKTGKKWAAQAQGNVFLVYLQHKQAVPEQLEEFIKTACRISQALLSSSKECVYSDSQNKVPKNMID
ncbi:MAG: hypothetical protein GY729_13145 [Desulfobacteraceae bacterium]|nr:hypothetical protein [Desulfobacteraceae bacterium]